MQRYPVKFKANIKASFTRKSIQFADHKTVFRNLSQDKGCKKLGFPAVKIQLFCSPVIKSKHIHLLLDLMFIEDTIM